jgi:hypothetical protein
MKYPLSGQRYPLFPWNRIFSMLSIPQFTRVYQYLDFPFYPTEALMQIAKDYCVTDVLLFPNPEYATAIASIVEVESPLMDLLGDLSGDASYMAKKIALFENTFLRLEKAGYADTVYQWGKMNAEYYPHIQRNALNAWIHLLRDWAGQRWQLELQSVECGLKTDELAALFETWQVGSEGFEPMPLPDEISNKIMCIIIRHKFMEFQLDRVMDEIWRGSKTVWEDFALRAGAAYISIGIEGRFKIRFREWRSIATVLTSNELEQLEEWTLSTASQRRKEKGFIIPLPILEAVY